MDEAEGLLHDRDMLTIVNAGYSRSTGTVLRAYRDSLRRYKTYCPKVIASIMPIPQTIVDRAIKIELQRLLEGESILPLREDDDTMAHDLLPAMQEWVEKHRDKIARTYRSADFQIDFLHARQADIWRPLFAIAHVLCPGRIAELQAAALRLNNEKTQFEQDTSPELSLLRDIRQVFTNLNDPQKLPTEGLITGLACLPESPWQNLTPLELSRKLLPFGIKPQQHWVKGRNFRGYAATNFQGAFLRYLTPTTATQTR